MLTIWREVCIVSLFVLLWSGVGACRPAPLAGRQDQAATVAQPVPPAAIKTAIGFRSPARLAEHFRKHGAEFEGYSEADYLRAAQALRDAAPGGEILEAERPDGTTSRFDRRTGAFVAFDSGGTIRTFFRPNDGEAYFRRQARRRQE